MSLGVYLYYNVMKSYDDGKTFTSSEEEVFESNITHNLNNMANAAEIYFHLWRPDEIGITKAKELINPLTIALKEMKSNPGKFKKFNASNGWGLYDDFVPWVEEYLNACIQNPESLIRVSR